MLILFGFLRPELSPCGQRNVFSGCTVPPDSKEKQRGCSEREVPRQFQYHVKLSFTNICGLRSNFVEFESFLQSSSPDHLALEEKNLNDSIDYHKFYVTGYLPLIRKNSITHMHGLAVYVKKGLPFAQELSLENSMDSLNFRLALLHSVPYFFFLY